MHVARARAAELTLVNLTVCFNSVTPLRHTEFHPDFPKPGVNFCDILPVLRDPIAFETLMTHFLHHVFSVTLPKLRAAAPEAERKNVKIDAVVGLDARGFLFGPQLAQRLGAAFLPVRKRGKLPGENVQAEYVKEYGTVSIPRSLYACASLQRRLGPFH